jgi:hypothetical protein
MCWVSVGVLPDGSQKILYESYEACAYPAVRVFNRDFDTFLQRAFWEELRSLQDRRERKRAPVVEKLRRSYRMRNVSEYFCASPLEQGAGVDMLYTVWLYSSVRYSDGKVYPMNEVVHAHSCKQKRSFSSGPFPKVERENGGRVRLVLP